MINDWLLALGRLASEPTPIEVLAVLLLAVPLLMIGRVLQRAGFSGWWALLVLVPVVNLVALWLFAYARWPALDRGAGPLRPAEPARG